LIGAILLSAYIGDMLGRRASVPNTHLNKANGGESISRFRQPASVADGIPAAVGQSVLPKEPTYWPTTKGTWLNKWNNLSPYISDRSLPLKIFEIAEVETPNCLPISAKGKPNSLANCHAISDRI